MLPCRRPESSDDDTSGDSRWDWRQPPISAGRLPPCPARRQLIRHAALGLLSDSASGGGLMRFDCPLLTTPSFPFHAPCPPQLRPRTSRTSLPFQLAWLDCGRDARVAVPSSTRAEPAHLNFPAPALWILRFAVGKFFPTYTGEGVKLRTLVLFFLLRLCSHSPPLSWNLYWPWTSVYWARTGPSAACSTTVLWGSCLVWVPF